MPPWDCMPEQAADDPAAATGGRVRHMLQNQSEAAHSTPLSSPELSIWATTCQPGPEEGYGALRPSSRNDRSISCSSICRVREGGMKRMRK